MFNVAFAVVRCLGLSFANRRKIDFRFGYGAKVLRRRKTIFAGFDPGKFHHDFLLEMIQSVSDLFAKLLIVGLRMKVTHNIIQNQGKLLLETIGMPYRCGPGYEHRIPAGLLH